MSKRFLRRIGYDTPRPGEHIVGELEMVSAVALEAGKPISRVSLIVRVPGLPSSIAVVFDRADTDFLIQSLAEAREVVWPKEKS